MVVHPARAHLDQDLIRLDAVSFPVTESGGGNGQPTRQGLPQTLSARFCAVATRTPISAGRGPGRLVLLLITAMEAWWTVELFHWHVG